MGSEHQTFVNTLRRIEVEYGRAGWHGEEAVPPALYGLFRASATRLRPIELEIDPTFWTMGRPGNVLVAIAKTAPRFREHMLSVFRRAEAAGLSFYGMALAMEAWMAKVR